MDETLIGVIDESDEKREEEASRIGKCLKSKSERDALILVMTSSAIVLGWAETCWLCDVSSVIQPNEQWETTMAPIFMNIASHWFFRHMCCGCFSFEREMAYSGFQLVTRMFFEKCSEESLVGKIIERQ